MYTMDEYQKRAAETATYQDSPFCQTELARVSYCVHGLTGEAGEIANKLKKVYRFDMLFDSNAGFIEAAKSELGDVLWYVAMLAKELGLTLDDIARYNVEKLADRKARGVLKGSGDAR